MLMAAGIISDTHQRQQSVSTRVAASTRVLKYYSSSKLLE